MNTYQTIETSSYGEFKDKGSRFLAYADPVLTTEEIKQYLGSLKKEHFKAVHHCYAYRLGYDENQFRANDDGEPAGSAGRPILGQIDSFQLTDIAVIVVRYFGGTLLGVPGLIHAYKTATAEALKKASIITKNIEKTIHLECAYEVLNTALQIIRRHQGNIIHQDLQLSCRIQVRIPVSHYENCRQQLLDTRAMTILE